MRDILTGLAIVLLLCLTGALVAPHFISWTNHREQVSAYLTEAVGQPIEVRGAIGITLFPSPSLKLGNVVLTGKGGISGDIGRLRLIGSIPPLLRGELKIVSANLDYAQLTIRPEKITSGSVARNNPLGAISIEKMMVTQSSITIERADGSLSQLGNNIQGSMEATSLAGPFRGGLNFTLDDQNRTLRFSTGKVENNQLRMKALVENETAAARSEFDGQLMFADGQIFGDGALSASGNATLPMDTLAADTPIPQVIWRLTTKVKGNRTAILFDDVELTLGQDDRQAIFTGNGNIDFSLPNPSKFTFSTRQIDVDRLLGDDNKQLPRAPDTLVQLVTKNAGKSISVPWLSGEVDVSAGSVILGRGVILGPRVIVSVKDGVSAIKHVSAELPGQSLILAKAGPEPQQLIASQDVTSFFRGDLSLESKDFTKLSHWFHGIPLRASAAKALRMTGELSQSKDSISISKATILTEGLNLTGDVKLHFLAPRMKLDLKLNSELLDIARLPTVAEIDGPDTMDFDIQLDAKRVQISGVGAGSVQIKARREDASIFLDTVSIKDIGGATLRASGSMGRAGSKLTGDLEATNLDGLLQLASRFSSHQALSVFLNRAPALVPAQLSFVLAPDNADIRTPTARLELKGRLRDTEIAGFLRLNEVGDLLPGEAADITVTSQSTASVLRQLGVEAIRLEQAGPLRLRLAAHGFMTNAAEAPWTVKGEMAQVAIDIRAQRNRDFAQPISGFLSLNTTDISQLAQTMLVAVPAVSPGQPLNLKSDFDLRGYKITLRDLEAKSGTGYIRGELAFNLAEFGRVAGQLQTSGLDVLSFAPLISGINADETPSGVWSAKNFGRVAPVTLPGDLWISAESVRLSENLRLEKPRFVLRFENGLIYIEYAESEAYGAKLKGAVTFRRMDKSVSITGRLGLTEASLGDGFKQNPLKGKIDGDIEFSAFADSPANLIASLSGAGKVRLQDIELNGVKQGVLADTVSSSLSVFDPSLHNRLASKLKSDFNGKTSLPPSQLSLVLAGGVLRAGPIPLITQQEELSSSFSIDLRSLSLFNETVIRLRESPRHWEGATPSASVIWKGPIAQPSMSVEATSLANGLTALAIARESERIDTLEQDQRERSLFNRRLQASQEEQKRLQMERDNLLQAKREFDARKKADDIARQRSSLPLPLVIAPPLVVAPLPTR